MTNDADAPQLQSDAALEVSVLGPVEVSFDGHPIDIGGAKSRALIARLLIDRDLTVSVDRLVDALWPENEGEGGEIALRSTVSRLRKRLRDFGVDQDLIVTRPPGYVLTTERVVIDAARFEQLMAEARRLLADADPGLADDVLTTALGLWRGPAFGEVADEEFARSEARRLEELRLAAVELRIEAGLNLGRHADLVAEIERLTTAHPLRERLWGQRMLALYRTGRQADALRVFQDLRDLLVDELGIEPGPEISRLEEQILAQSSELDWVALTRERPAPVTSVVRSPSDLLPAVEGSFVGRSGELALLEQWWSQLRGMGSRLMLISGEPGIGKTSLARAIAHQIAADEDALVLWGRCDEEPIGPYQPFSEALTRYFHGLTDAQIESHPPWRIAELARLVVRLRRFTPTRGAVDVSDPDADRYRFFEAVTDQLSELSTQRRVLLILDDLHWADRPTLLLARHLLRSAEAVGPSIIATYRDSDYEGTQLIREFLSELRTERPPDRIKVLGLDVSAIQELVGTSGGDESAARQLHRMTDGHPLLLDEMIRQLAVSDGTRTLVPEELATPEAVKELVARRVSRLPDEVIRFLQAAAVAGPECEASIAAAAAGLTPDQRLDAIDAAVEARLIEELPGGGERYTFIHALTRAAIYEELLRGRRVRLHNRIAAAIEAAHPEPTRERYLNQLAHHYRLGASFADADKAISYSFLAGDRAVRLLAYEEAVEHYLRSIEVLDHYGPDDPALRCDALISLAEARNRAGDAARADPDFEEAAALARSMGDARRLARAALRQGPLSYMGIIEARPEVVRLLDEARQAIGNEDPHLLAMVTARLALVEVYAGQADAEVTRRALSLSAEAIAIARKANDRAALGYALNARLHALWGIGPAPERLAIGTELGQIADEVQDDLLALHGHMWRVRELLAQGDIEATQAEVRRFDDRRTGPTHPLVRSYGCAVRASMALVQGELEEGERLALESMNLALGHSDLAFSLYGAQMSWTWWMSDRLVGLESTFREILDQAPDEYPIVNTALALLYCELGNVEGARTELDRLAAAGWDRVAVDQTEGVALSFAAAVCGMIGAADHAPAVYAQLRPYAGTAIVIRAPASACMGPADLYLGMLALAMDDTPLADVHFDAALRMSERMGAPPFVATSQLGLAQALMQAGRPQDAPRIKELLDAAATSAERMGLSRIARLAHAAQGSA